MGKTELVTDLKCITPMFDPLYFGREFLIDEKDRDVPIPPKRSNSSVSDLPTIPGEGPFEETVNIPKKSYSVVNLSHQPNEKKKAATLPRKSSQAKVCFI